jgi:hypothetical protein
MATGVGTSGLAYIVNWVGGIGGTAATTYVAVGTSSTAWTNAQTALVAETTGNGLDRASVTPTAETTNVAGDTLQLQKVFTVSGAVTVAEAGAFNAAYPSGTMLCRGVFSPTKSVTAGDSFTVTVKVVFS